MQIVQTVMTILLRMSGSCCPVAVSVSAVLCHVVDTGDTELIWYM